jgi:hypothetical protein
MQSGRGHSRRGADVGLGRSMRSVLCFTRNASAGWVESLGTGGENIRADAKVLLVDRLGWVTLIYRRKLIITSVLASNNHPQTLEVGGFSLITKILFFY